MSLDASSAAVADAPEAGSGIRARRVAIVGAPNTGKSTLFNRLTGLRQKVANYPGVTVEKRTGMVTLGDGKQVELTDLPGVYSLDPASEDERVTYEVLHGERDDAPQPEAVLLVIDSTNLGRNLSLAAPILQLGLPLLVVLNMADELAERGGSVDPSRLSTELGTPVALVSARSGDGVEKIFEFLQDALTPPRIELPVLNSVAECRKWSAAVGAKAGYGPPAPPAWSRRLDSVFLHPLWGPAIFAVVVVAVFQTIFAGAQPLMDGVEWAIARSGEWLAAVLPESWLTSLLIEGVWGGVGAVVVFLPQILLLFLFIGILEDSGYMARAALVADRTLRSFGLQGKSFIPLLSAYACAVPAILATRTIESKRDRMATILVAPFMTCSARLPVYTLLIAAFVPEQAVLGGLLGTRAVTMIGLYALGFLAALVTARVLKSSILRSDGVPFVMELPPYRAPTLRSLLLRLWDRSKIFLRRAGTIILPVTVLLWLLASLPIVDGQPSAVEDSLAATIGKSIEPLLEPLGFNWKIGIGLVASLAAREVIVGTLATLYGMATDEPTLELQQALQGDLDLGSAVALMIFFVFALQCLSTVAVVKRETGGWTWPVIQFGYMLALAYAGAWVARVLISA